VSHRGALEINNLRFAEKERESARVCAYVRSLVTRDTLTEEYASGFIRHILYEAVTRRPVYIPLTSRDRISAARECALYRRRGKICCDRHTRSDDPGYPRNAIRSRRQQRCSRHRAKSARRRSADKHEGDLIESLVLARKRRWAAGMAYFPRREPVAMVPMQLKKWHGDSDGCTRGASTSFCSIPLAGEPFVAPSLSLVELRSFHALFRDVAYL